MSHSDVQQLEQIHAPAQVCSKLANTDWNQEWIQLQETRNKPDNAALWDARAKTFPNKHGDQSPYVAAFLEKASITAGETVLDMGCGTGSLALPLAKQGASVIAADFSQGMLGVLQKERDILSLDNLKTIIMSWDDDWAEFGITENCVDVALASRSIATYDLKSSLMKLHTVAKRRVCITVPVNISPKADGQLLQAAGISHLIGHEYLYSIAILIQNGIEPEVSYIASSREESYESFEDALETLASIVETSAHPYISEDTYNAIRPRINGWLKDNLIVNPRSGQRDKSGYTHAAYCLRQPRRPLWACIAWNTTKEY